MPKDKQGRNYTIRSKKGKDGKMHKYPHYAGSGGSGGSKSKGSSGGGGGSSSGKSGNKRTSVVTLLAVGGGGLAVAGGLGYAQATIIQDEMMRLAGMIGIVSGAGLLAAAVALKIASKPKAKKIPLIGGMVYMVGTEWAAILADVNLRP